MNKFSVTLAFFIMLLTASDTITVAKARDKESSGKLSVSNAPYNELDSLFIKYWNVKTTNEQVSEHDETNYLKWKSYHSLWDSLTMETNDTILISVYRFIFADSFYFCATLKRGDKILLKGLPGGYNDTTGSSPETVSLDANGYESLIDPWEPDSLRAIARWWSGYVPQNPNHKCWIESMRVITDANRGVIVDTVSYKTWKSPEPYRTPRIIQIQKRLSTSCGKKN